MSACRGDRGAYAVLFALVMVVLIGVAAFVVDLGGARLDRRRGQAAADAAALAGAARLTGQRVNLPGPVSTEAGPATACARAWEYLEANLVDLGADGAADRAAQRSCAPYRLGLCRVAPALPVARPVEVGDYTVTVTWPVAAGSALMTTGDGRAPDPEVDGTDPCRRLGVTVRTRRPFAFAGALPGAPSAVGTIANSVAVHRDGDTGLIR